MYEQACSLSQVLTFNVTYWTLSTNSIEVEFSLKSDLELDILIHLSALHFSFYRRGSGG